MSDEEFGPETPKVVQIEDTSVRHPWERQDGESERAWQCFQAYRDSPVPRYINRNATYVNNVRVASGEISKWYFANKWEERCTAYDVLTDRVMEAQRRRFLEESAQERAGAQLAALSKLRTILSLELDKYLEAAMAGNAPGLIKPADLKGLMETEIKMTRLIKGETTEEVGVSTSEGIDQLDPTELMAWRERLKKKPATPKKSDEDPN